MSSSFVITEKCAVNPSPLQFFLNSCWVVEEYMSKEVLSHGVGINSILWLRNIDYVYASLGDHSDREKITIYIPTRQLFKDNVDCIDFIN